MIIVDEGASDKLVNALKGITDLEGKHCIRIHAASGNRAQAQQKITVQTQRNLPGCNLYFCEDGEIFLLAHQGTASDCRKLMAKIAATLEIEQTDTVGELYDLALQTGSLLTLLETKIKAQQKNQETAQKQQAQEQAAARASLRRKEILNQGVSRNAEQIAAQRRLRGEPLVMMIEDDPFSRRLVENVLQKHYRLTGLASAEDALSTYADLAPNILFLDINLPDVTGHELLEKLIALDPQAYVVMLSGNADKQNIMQAMDRGAVGFVAKPFSRDKLFQYIERCPTIAKEKVQ